MNGNTIDLECDLSIGNVKGENDLFKVNCTVLKNKSQRMGNFAMGSRIQDKGSKLYFSMSDDLVTNFVFDNDTINNSISKLLGNMF